MIAALATRRGAWRVRFGLAGALVLACAMAGVAGRCDDMPGTPVVALALLVVVQGITALGSFAAGAIAAARSDWRRVRSEAGIGLAMLRAIPVAALALFSLSPTCAC
ncbi:MAG: hypothetical protein ACJ8G1_05285 [Vitreoscilla sp.]